MKKIILIALAVAALLGGRPVFAANASPSIITSTATINPVAGGFLAAPPVGYVNFLNGCSFGNGYSAGMCLTISSSVSGEPSVTLCALSSTTYATPPSFADGAAGRDHSGLNALYGQNLAYSGALTVTSSNASCTGTTCANAILTCGYRQSNALGL